MHHLLRGCGGRALQHGSSSARVAPVTFSPVQRRRVATGVCRSISSLGLPASEGTGASNIAAASFATMPSISVGSQMCSNNFFLPVDVEKPMMDYREYRLARLENNLQVLLISDPKCDRAAAALSVQVGSISDPREIQGLAHFCEHMLFLGTDKYPSESEYNTYLSKNGGSSNAYTAESATVYYFGVKPESLEGALDRFAQFFISPLFTESATERELLAVDSEHSKNIQQDGWRQQQLLRSAVDDAHPLNHFMTGNSETLRDLPAKDGVNVRTALLDFHAKYYSANLMSVVIVGREDPDTLMNMARSHFSPILDRSAKVPQGLEVGHGVEAFPPCRRGRLVHVVPVRDVRLASFQFIVPSQKDYWRSKPVRYICHLVGHEGSGSLLTALKLRGLATELSAGESLDEAGVGMLSVNIVLTEHGEANIREVGELLFAYIDLLRKRGPEKTIFDELQRLGDLSFRFRSLTDSMNTASHLAHYLQDYPPEFMLSASAKLWDYEPAKIEALLNRLNTGNLRLVLSSKSYVDRCKSKEKWYGTSYSDQALDSHLREAWDHAVPVPDLIVPQPNPFVPEDLDLRPTQHPHPVFPELLDLGFRVGDVDAGRVATAYYRKDEQFKLPKATCSFQIYCPFTHESVHQRTLAELWCHAVKEELNEFSYDAHVAGLNYSLNASILGMSLSVSGYNDKLPELLAAVSRKMTGLVEIPKETFEIVQRIAERDLSNAALLSSPYQQAFDFESCAVNLPAHSLKERLAAVRNIKSHMDLSGIGPKLLGNCHVECLLQGNLSTEEARGLVRSFLEPLSISKPLDVLPSRGVARIAPGWTQLHREGTNPDERNGAVVVNVQVAEESLQSRCLMDLAGQILGQRFFDELRTKQQLGYIVSASSYGERQCFVGFRMLVQSERPSEEVVNSIRSWLGEAVDFLQNGLTSDEFDEYRNALTSKLRERTKSLGEEFGRNWTEVASRGFSFNRREELAAHLDNLRLSDLQEFANTFREAPALCTIVSPVGSSPEPPVAGSFSADQKWTPADVREFRKDASWRFRNSVICKQIPGNDASSSCGHSRL